MRRKIAVCILFLSLINLSFISSAKPCFAQELMKEQSQEYFKEGIKAQKTGDIDKAISLYTKAILTNPYYPQAHNNLGTAYMQKGSRTKAEEEYNRAIAIDPYYSVALKNLAILYLERKEYDKFYEYWKRATGLNIYSPFLIDEEG